MNDDAALFWENVKNEIKVQNTTQEWVAKKADISFNTLQGWIAKGICPRVNEAIRIAAVLNTSVEYLARGTLRNNSIPIETISSQVIQIHECLGLIQAMVKKLK